MINDLAKQIHENNKEKGFYNDKEERNMGEILALIHSEVSEALEADREDNYTYKGGTPLKNWMHISDDKMFKAIFEQGIKSTFEDELADIVIRVMDLAAYKNIDLEHHILAKVRYNTLRASKHGKKY